MPVKATLRKPAAPATIRQDANVIDVEATTTTATKPASAEEFANNLAATDPADASEQAVAVRPPAAVVHTHSSGGFRGEWDESDTKLPQLKIVNGSGELSSKFNQGTLIYADEKLWEPPSLEKGAVNPSMTFVPLILEKQLRENLTQEEQDDGLMPRIVSSRAEAVALTGAGSTEWVNGQKPRWSPSAKCVLLLEAPQGCEHPGFCTILDGKTWAFGVYYASGMAYNHFAKMVYNAAPVSLREPGNPQPVLFKKNWTWEVVKVPAGKYQIFVPKIRLTKLECGPEVRAFAENLTGKAIQSQE